MTLQLTPQAGFGPDFDRAVAFKKGMTFSGFNCVIRVGLHKSKR